ncbi:hypothetical protein [Vibrio mediterranei]|nr:hypothetical protein [Vibrio mediterranei]
MTDSTAMEALFIQQRLQIMSLGVHHDEFSDSYLHAWLREFNRERDIYFM